MEELKDKKLENENYELPEKPDYEAQLVTIIRSEMGREEIRNRLDDFHENDIASALGKMEPQERIRLYRILGIERVSEIFAYLEDDDVGGYINELNADDAADILEEMDADDAADILDELDEEKRADLIKRIDQEAGKDIALIRSYDDDEIGSKMATNFITLELDLTIRQAMKSLVAQAADNDNITTLYVLKKDTTFYGAIDLKDLIVAREYQELESLVMTSYPYVFDHESITDCIEDLKDYSEDSIPVLDTEMHLLGVLTSQDLIEVVDEEMGEDYAKLAGLTCEEDLNETLMESMKKRIPWLLILLMLGLMVSTVVGLFEHVVAQLTIIVCFQSLILDMAGNVGTQSLAVTIRVLMDENLTFEEERRLIFKELRVGFTNGLLLGSLSFLFIGSYIWLFKQKTMLFAFSVSGCIGASLWLAMIVSSFIGTVIPIFFKKIKVDPAVASGPLITTVNDLVAVVTYYGLTWVLLLNILQLVE